MNYQRLSQEELDNRINVTRAYIHRQTKRKEDSKDSEMDLCYLQREEEHREKTRILHNRFLEENEMMRREEEEALRDNDGELSCDE